MRGPLLTAAEAGYDAARRIWNAMIDKRPALIARCAGPADVLEAVRFAAAQAIVVSVRGGGHNVAGTAVCDGGLMIDLSLMKGVQVDPGARRATVEPGCTLADFDAAAQAHGLATPLGINSTTGVAGLTLGGGFGWLSRKYGMTVDNLLSVDVVTADGKQVRASETENADLFWGLRGGGGNFGIVTSFEFQLHPVGPDVLSGLIAFPFDQAKSVITRPSPGIQLAGAGIYEITGVAWSGYGKIAKVDVSADGGKSWAAAMLQEPVLPMALTRFRIPWQWDGGPAVLQSRTVDGSGYVQPSRDQLIAERGAKTIYHYNGITSWGISINGELSHVYA
jgi:FAD/FMN-containing dehydrogenase